MLFALLLVCLFVVLCSLPLFTVLPCLCVCVIVFVFHYVFNCVVLLLFVCCDRFLCYCSACFVYCAACSVYSAVFVCVVFVYV